jgi:hypothetical protein
MSSKTETARSSAATHTATTRASAGMIVDQLVAETTLSREPELA